MNCIDTDCIFFPAIIYKMTVVYLPYCNAFDNFSGCQFITLSHIKIACQHQCNRNLQTGEQICTLLCLSGHCLKYSILIGRNSLN